MILLIALIWSGCATTKSTSSASYIGDYESLVKDTPNGDATGTFTIRHDGTNYFAKLSSDMGSVDIHDFKIEGNKITGYFWLESYKIDVNGEITGNEIKGTMGTEGYTFPWTGTKK